jgi:tetratricopeptide (TPR) repeat protein
MRVHLGSTVHRATLCGLVFLAFTVAGTRTTRAQDMKVEASVDRTVATLDDQIQLEIIVRGNFQNPSQPVQPAMPDFDVFYRGRSQSISIVNGKMDASYAYKYVLVPKREGTLVIQPFEFRHKGKPHRTEPIHVTVSGQAPTGAAASAGRDMFVVARVDADTAYVNQQVLYTFYLYAALRVSNLNYTAPPFEGFWVEKLQEGEKQYHKIVDGRRYLVIEVSTAIFPTTSGTLKIDPARLRLVELSERSFSFFDRGVERVLRSRPVEVHVKPLPAQGRPADFDGAVGEEIAITARLDRGEVEEGEPITMTVHVRGAGNVRTFSRPRIPDLPHFKVYDADSKTQVRSLERVTGSRTYEIVLVPREAGQYTVPPVRMSYFDTEFERYRSVETDPMQLVAVRTARSQRRLAEARPHVQQQIEVLGEDIAHIRSDVSVSDDLTPLYRRGVFMALLPLPLMVVAGSLLVQRRRHRLATDVALARSTRARKEARKRLIAAERFLKAGRSEEFYAEISRALLQYVGDKLNVSAVGLTHDGMRARMGEAGAGAETCARVVGVLEHCDAARFSPGSFTDVRMRQVVQDVEALVTDLESSWNRKTSQFVMATVALWMCLAVSAASVPAAARGATPGTEPSVAADNADAHKADTATEDTAADTATENADADNTRSSQGLRVQHDQPSDFQPPELVLERANAAYESGRFAEAIDGYRQAATLGVRNGPLYYNMGNAYFKNGDLAGAIASYRRAERLMPRDPLLRANLEFARSQREDKAVQSPIPWPLSLMRDLFRWLSLNEWVIVTATLYLVVCALALWVVLGRRRPLPLRIALYSVLVLFLMSSVTLAFKIHDERGVERGVVSAQRISVMSGPGADYTVEFWLHTGTEVQVEVRRPEWLRVTLGGNLRGWIPASAVVDI